MRHVWALMLLCACCSCKMDRAGRPCTTDDVCGSGYDCFEKRCVRVCTQQEDCIKGEVCTRHRCIDPNFKPVLEPTPTAKPATKKPPKEKVAIPTDEEASVAELRALRRQLDLVMQQQALMRKEIDALKQRTPR